VWPSLNSSNAPASTFLLPNERQHKCDEDKRHRIWIALAMSRLSVLFALSKRGRAEEACALDIAGLLPACLRRSARARRSLPQPLINLPQIELPKRRAEVLVVEDLLVDLVVGVNARDDRL
jgi:hypothetical protein